MNQIEDLLRTSLQERVRLVEPTTRGSETDVRRRAQRYRRRHRLVPAIGATAVLATGVGVLAVRQSDDARTSTASHAPEEAAPVLVGPGGGLPLLALPGWTTARYQEIEFESQPSPVKVVIEGDDVKVLVMVLAPPMGYALGDGTEPVDVNGIDAEIVERDDELWLAWSVGEITVVLNGQGVDDDELVAVARGLSFEGDDLRIASVGHVPDGATAATIDEPAGRQLDAEYGFTRDDQRLQLHLYDGGRGTYEFRISGDRRSSVEVLGRPASLLDYGTGRYRVDVLVDGRTWEFDGEPFASAEDFLAAVSSTEVVDQDAWQRSVADADVSTFDATTGSPQSETATTVPAAK